MKNVLYKIEHALLNKGLINKEQLDKTQTSRQKNTSGLKMHSSNLVSDLFSDHTVFLHTIRFAGN